MSEESSLVIEDRMRTDRQMLWLLLAHVPVVALLVPIGYGTYGFAMFASLAVGALAAVGYGALRGTRGCSVVFAACLMLFSAVMIQAQMGRIEMHFHIFAALALVIIYRDWLPVVTGALVIAVHHLLLTGLQLAEASAGQMPVMIFNYGCSWSIALLHAAFVVFEASILTFFAWQMGRERQRNYETIRHIRAFDEEGDLSGRLEVLRGDRSGNAFNNLMDQFSDLILRVRTLSARLHENAGELTAVGDHTNRVAEEQSSEMSQVASAMEEMTRTIQSVSEGAQQAAEASDEAAGAVSNGSRNVRHSVTLTESTDGALGEASHMVAQLVAQVQSIGTVVASINDISEQTNLLALNAAIEAARAGEHGRGFAVVADEVRNLSRRTQTFTDEIRTTIDELSRVSEGSLAAIEVGQTRSRETSLSVREAGEAFGAIESAIATLRDINTLVASTSEEQAAASVQINDSIQRVSAAQHEVVSQAARARELAVELESVVGEVDALIRGLRTGE
ncbi:MAG TPA: methyl-accepting chemotaxis protein [Marinobacter sp.]|nr:methyl-accepting chemotaxis protein [Marinobacter sp.]